MQMELELELELKENGRTKQHCQRASQLFCPGAPKVPVTPLDGESLPWVLTSLKLTFYTVCTFAPHGC